MVLDEDKIDEGNKLIAEFVGLKIRWVDSPGYAGESGDWDMEIDFPDFFDHDEQLAYLYETEIPEENYKFHSSWDWLMGVVEKIKFSTFSDDWVSGNKVVDEYLFYWDNIKDSLLAITITNVFNSVVEYIMWYNRNNKQPFK